MTGDLFGQTITPQHKRVYWFVNAEPWNMYETRTPKVQIKVRLVLENVYMKESPNSFELGLSLEGKITTITHMKEEMRRYGRQDKFMSNQQLEQFKTGAPLTFTPIGIPTPNSYWLQNGMYFALTPTVNGIYKTTKYDNAGYPYFYVDTDIKHYDKEYVKELSSG